MILDATALLLLLNEKMPPPKDPATGKPIDDAHQRVEALVAEIAATGKKVIVTAPVLAELLVRAENAASAYVSEFSSSSVFKLESFDQKAAIEHALTTRKAIEAGDKRDGVVDDWAKVKFDRQIVAIATALQEKTICTDDKNLKAHAEKQGIHVLGICDLKLNVQMPLELKDPSEQTPATPAETVSEAKSDGAAVAPTTTKEGNKATPEESKTKEKGSAVVETAPPSV